jgi:NAD(P)-dependent dehydrogenase (short-subunit alcohol dehydrogenase family)
MAARASSGIPWTAVVIGGASGIEAAVSRKLASRSINVLIADVNAKAGEKLAAEIKAEFHVDAVFQSTCRKRPTSRR